MECVLHCYAQCVNYYDNKFGYFNIVGSTSMFYWLETLGYWEIHIIDLGNLGLWSKSNIC
jgi:hypothetical protein